MVAVTFLAVSLAPATGSAMPGASSSPTGASAASGARPAQAGGPSTVDVYGKTGTFGSLSSTQVPSGHSLTQHPIPGWQFPAGRLPFMTNVAGDGTVFMGGMDFSTNNVFPSSPSQVIGTFDPATGTPGAILNKTSGGPTAPGGTTTVNRSGVADGGSSVADVRPIRGGQAMAFTAWVTLSTNGVDAEGVWPVFGILTKVNGQWQVASGASWRNQWTGAQLRASNASSSVDETACPAQPAGSTFAGQSECGGLNEVTELPSGDLVVTQYLGAKDDVCGTGHHGGFAVIRPGNPDAQGRFQPTVVGQYTYPDHIQDTTTPAPNDCLSISPIGVEADPTSTNANDQRFVAMYDVYTVDGSGSRQRNVVQEFRFNASSGAITPVSAPILPGDLHPAGVFWGFSGAIYDHDGNLWVTRNNAAEVFTDELQTGGNLAVFANIDGERKLADECAVEPGQGMGDYRTSDATLGLQVWGKACEPDYDIVQANTLGFSGALMQDPVSHDIVSVGAGLGGGARVLAVRPSGSGANMSFEVGNVVDLGTNLLPKDTPTGPGLVLPQWSGGIDGHHRLWLSVYDKPQDTLQCYPVGFCLPRPNQLVNSWLYSVDVTDLLDPPATVLPTTSGQIVGIHAEQTSTVSTTERAGSGADREFDSDAYFRACTGACSTTDLNPGDGFYLADDGFNPFGLLGHTGGPVQYEVSVATGGTYTLGYYVSTLRTSGAKIRAQVGSSTVDTDVSRSQPCPPPDQANPCPDPTWSYKVSTPITIPAGTHTLTLSAPVGAELWSLNWFTLTRQ
jgi:hypothetical protein